MKTFIKTLALISSIFLLDSKSTNAQCHIDDWTALKAFYESTNGINWTNRTGWDVQIHNRTSPPTNCNLSNLFGIFTENGRVTCIDLDGGDNCNYSTTDGNNLVGTIPPELENLGSLSSLRLSNNLLTGGIPIELQNLNDLTRLYLDNNQLNGLPQEIGNFSSLNYLWLQGNNFSGNIPSEIGNLTNLSQLYLDHNEFEGSIPSSIGNLINLTYLDLGGNQFTGSIPIEIGNLTNLISLSIYETLISGSIPIQLGNLPNLEGLNLSNNPLLGGSSTLAELGNLVRLKILWLGGSNLSGIIPPNIGNLVNLESLGLRGNNLTGQIPNTFVNLTQLKELTFSENNFQGDVLDIIVNLPNLEFFQASSNQFTGIIPSSIGNLAQLKEFSLYNNNFSGNLPQELGNLTQLTKFYIGQNQFGGCFPNGLSNICNVITSSFNDGNNFDMPIEDFCTTGAGACCTNSGCTDDTACNYNPDATCDDNSCLQNCNEDFVYPGDLNHDGIVNHQDMGLSGSYLYEVGPPRASEHQNNDWYAYPAIDWNRQQQNNEDYKHFDCNGDGEITDADHQAVEDNMGRMWLEELVAFDGPEESEYLVRLLPAHNVANDYLILNVSLERRTGSDLNIQGGHFTIDYSDIFNIDYATLNFNNESWLGEKNVDLLYEKKHTENLKKFEIGFTKLNNSNSIGSGIIGDLIISLNVNQSAKTFNNMFEISVNTIGTHNGFSFTPIEDQVLQIVLGNYNCQSNLTINEDSPFQKTYKSNNSIATNGFVLIGADQQVTYKATGSITLNSGFRVKAGADFSAKIEPCD